MRFNKVSVFLLFLFLISVIKLVFGYPYHHQDADQFFYWGRFLGENGFDHFYEWGIPDSMPQTYPPVIYYVFFAARRLYSYIHDLVWYLHLRIPYYFFRRNTSIFIPWLETKLGAVTFNKIPAIAADALNSYLIYQIVMWISGKKKQKLAFILAGIFILSPAIWYSSSIWGQVDSLYILGILASLICLLKEKILISMILLLFSILAKPTAIYAAPIFLFLYLQKADLLVWLKGVLLSIAMVFLLYLPFDQSGNFLWIGQFFKNSLSGEQNQMVSNAFNFWVLPLNFNNYPDSTIFLGLPLYIWGYGLYCVMCLVLISFFWKIRKKMFPKLVILGGFLFSLLAFLVLPKVHERYFYPALIFSLLMAQFGKKWLVIFLYLSIFHFFNLYHFWWVSRFEPLVTFLSNMIVIKLMIVAEIMIFLYGVFYLAKEKDD